MIGRSVWGQAKKEFGQIDDRKNQKRNDSRVFKLLWKEYC